MTTQNVHVITEDFKNLSEVSEAFALLQKQFRFLQNKGIDSENAREIGGWLIDEESLSSTDGDVGMSTEDTTADDVRFFAGGVDKNTAPWRVSKSGKMVATGALIQSKDGTYPQVKMDPSGDLFGAYKDASNYIEIDADYLGSPVINIYQNGTLRGQIASATLNMLIAATTDLRLESSAGDVTVAPGIGKYLRVGTFARIFGTSEGKDLLTVLGEKVNTTTAFASYGVNMSFDPGTRNLKLFAGNGTTLATVNIP